MSAADNWYAPEFRRTYSNSSRRVVVKGVRLAAQVRKIGEGARAKNLRGLQIDPVLLFTLCG